jgi:hypothetical protein
MDNWEFYVVPTKFLNEHYGDNKPVLLGRITGQGAVLCLGRKSLI